MADIFSDDAHIDDADFHSSVISGSTCDGSIILCHAPDRPARLQTLRILSASLPLLHERGFRVTTLTDMFKEEGGSLGPCNIGILLRFLVVWAICTPCGVCCAACCKACRK